METLTLNDGTVLLNSSAYVNDNRMFVYIENGYSIQAVFNLLIDPNKTEKIVQTAPDFKRTFEGFTRLTTITDEGNGRITAMLKR